LGKKTKDLFKKSYDYKHEVKVISKADSCTIETGGYHSKALTGYAKANWADNYGAFELEGHSNGDTRGKFVSKKVGDAVFTIEGTGNAADAVVSGEAAYAKDKVAVCAKATHSANRGTVGVNLSAGFLWDGVTGAGSVSFDAANPTALSDYNIGAEMAQKDLVVSVVTSNQLNDLTGSVFQTVSSRLSLGCSILAKPDAGTREFTFGGDYSVDKDTSLKFKLDTNGTAATALTRTLSNPAVKVLASAQFNLQKSGDIFAPTKYGLSLCFGDF
jgi:hypothetical protein